MEQTGYKARWLSYTHMTGNRRPEAVRSPPRGHLLCQRKEELLRPAPLCTSLSITRLSLASQAMLKAGRKLLWPTSLAFISTVCKQSPICKAKLQLSPRQFLPLKGEMGVRMRSLRWLCRMRVEGAAPWMPSAFILSLGGSWLGSALYRCWTLSKSLGLFTLHVDTIACSLGVHRHL